MDTLWWLAVTHVATALVFLLLGWRFGREASGRPMFAFPVAPAPQGPEGEEADPWAVAAGQAPPSAAMDRNETDFTV